MNKATDTLLHRFFGRFMKETATGRSYEGAKRAWYKTPRIARAVARRRMKALLDEVERREDVRPEHKPRIVAAIEPLFEPEPMPRVARQRLEASDRRKARAKQRRRRRVLEAQATSGD